MFIDSHAHLTSPNNELSQRESLLQELERAVLAKVQAIINIATDETSLTQGLVLEKQVSAPKIHTVAATTPHDVAKDGAHFFPIVEKAALEKKLVAIGETGLDYYYEHAPRAIQQEYLRKYLQLAKRAKLPVVIHCRDAFHDFYSIVDEEMGQEISGVLHCFTGTKKEALEGIQRGFYVSFSGIITFSKSSALQEVVRALPLEKMLIETDSPYLAPLPYRGKKNEPSYVVETAKMLAQLKNVSLDEVALQTSQNTKKLFNFI